MTLSSDTNPTSFECQLKQAYLYLVIFFSFLLIILYKVSPLNAHVCFLMFNFSLKFVIKSLKYMDLSMCRFEQM